VLGAGHGNWRLPTKEELQSLVGTEVAPKEGWFWSSSPVADNSGYAWNVDFNDGSDYYGYKDFAYRVRLVRSGQ